MSAEVETATVGDGDTGIFDPEQIVAELEVEAKAKKVNPKLDAKRRLEEMAERKRLERQLKEYYDDV